MRDMKRWNTYSIATAAMAVIATIVGIGAAGQSSIDWDASAQRWWAHVEFLADDKLEGRHTGTTGFQLAAGYVEKQFREAGLKPAGTKGYFQEVAFDVVRLNESGTSWEIERDGQQLPVQLGTDALVRAHVEGDGRVDAGRCLSDTDSQRRRRVLMSLPGLICGERLR